MPRGLFGDTCFTDRTVKAHVEHCLDKLGYASRAQIAVWAAEHGLLRETLGKSR
jgi:DNA-binding NarL/FixJ family response regulator